MDRPKTTQNSRTGTVGSMGAGVKSNWSRRWPCWKIHTSAPNEAVIESTSVTTALMGSTTEPSSRNNTTMVMTTM